MDPGTTGAGKHINLLAIISDIPASDYARPGVTAVHIVVHELLRALQAQGHAVTLQPLFNRNRTTPLNELESAEFKALEKNGFAILPPFYADDYLPKPSLLARLNEKFLWGGIADWYPSVRLKSAIEKRIQQAKAEAVLTLWSQEGAAATHGISVPRIVYHGDVDYLLNKARMADPHLFAGGETFGLIKTLYRRYRLKRLQHAELAMLKDATSIAHITKCNAEYFTAHGHPRSVYVGNLWSDRANRPMAGSPAAGGDEIKIIGHFGRLSATGGTYGLQYLLKHVAPALRRRFAGKKIRIHIIGAGQINAALKPLLDQEGIIVRGFVEDLDSEIKSAKAVLMLNNAGRYYAAFTRHIVVWSLGGCLICHANSRKAIPEIENEKNALVGATPDEIAALVQRACDETDLNQRLRKAGRQTYETVFRPEHVAGRIQNELIWAKGAR